MNITARPIPTHMRAMLLTGFGSTDKLQYRDDVPVPTPGPHQVLIEVGACGVNNTDVWTREGAYGASEEAGWQGSAFTFPRIQGMDAVGRIVALGQGVPPERLGQRVMVNPTIYAPASGPASLFQATYLGSEVDGGFAQYVCVPDSNAHAVNSPLSDAELATFMTSYMTAQHMLNRAQLEAGETLLVPGASGGVGSALVQLARIRGARVAVIIGQDKAHALQGLDVAAVMFRGETDLAGQLQQQLGRASVDVVADLVAGEQVPQLLELLRDGGRYVTAGAIAGAMVTLDWRKIYLKHLSILGATMGSQAESLQIVDYVERGLLKPLLSATYPLKDLVQAQQDFKTRKHFGKLVMTM
jgi:NADPH:quinone reductase-like Zn-dependent oxidoreductase